MPAIPGDGLPGLEGSRYTSPTFEWSMEIDDTHWHVVESTSTDSVDSLILHGTEAGTPSTAVRFHTSSLEHDAAEFRLVQAAAVLDSALPASTIGIATDDTGWPIFGFYNESFSHPDGYWIASFVSRHESNPTRDRIVEMDSIEIPRRGGILIITATSPPDEYASDAYYLVEDLRSSISTGEREPRTNESQEETFPNPSPAGGGSRPMVQY